MSPAAELVIVGGGEHARVVADAALSRPDLWVISGFVDPKPAEGMTAMGVRRLGSDLDVLAGALSGRVCIIGVGVIGVSPLRAQLARRYEASGARFASVIHARAVVSPAAHIGEGVTVLAGAIVNPGARVGDHCIVNTGAVVEHDVVLSPFAHVGPGAIVGGGARIGEGAYLGLGSRVRDHIEVAAGALVGMGAVVVASVRAGGRVMGVPAREAPV